MNLFEIVGRLYVEATIVAKELEEARKKIAELEARLKGEGEGEK